MVLEWALGLYYTKGKDLLKKSILEVIGKNFRFLDTQLFEIYQILEEFYNCLYWWSPSNYLPKISKIISKVCYKVTKN